MAYNFYKAGETEPLSPAYNAYVAAQVAKADRAQRRTELTVQSLLELGQQRDRRKASEEGLKVEREKVKADADWHERYGNLQERQIKVQEDELAVKAARRDTLARAYGGGLLPKQGAQSDDWKKTYGPRGRPVGIIDTDTPEARARSAEPWPDRGLGGMARSLLSGSTSTDGSQGGGGGPGGSAGGARQPHYLEQFGLSQQDLATLEPSDIEDMQRMGMAFEDQQRQNETAAQKQQADEAEIAGAHASVDAAGDEAIPKAMRAQMKLRIADAASAKEVNKEVTGHLEELHAKEMAQGELDAMIPETEKLLKEARPGDLQGLARLKAFKKVQGHTASDPRKDLELFKKERAEILGTKDSKAEGEKGYDIPGVGTNINPTTPIAQGGKYKLDESGKPVLPKDINAELTLMAQHSLRSDPGFAAAMGRLAEVVDSKSELAGQFKKLEDGLIERQKGLILDYFKWEPEPQAEKPKPATEAPKQSAAPANVPPPTFSSEYPEQTKAIVELWKTDPEAAIREIVKLRKGTGATSIIDKPVSAPSSWMRPGSERREVLRGGGPF